MKFFFSFIYKIFIIILSILWRIWFIFINIILIPLLGCISIPFIFSKKYYYIAYLFHSFWGQCNLFLMGFRYTLIKKYKELIKKNESYIVISNHVSILDIMLIYSIFKKNIVIFVGKYELVKIPIFGYIYKKCNILVKRTKNRKVFEEIKNKIMDGKSICIFPEGCINNNKNILLLPFKNGAFSIAIKTGKPILAFTIADLKHKFPYNFFKNFFNNFFTIGKPGNIRVKQHKIIITKNLNIKYKNKLKKKCFNMIYYQLIKFKKNYEFKSK
ncbi:MAG: 1-acyl-sn-glycerol-3-phosphate acyltransferase [Candidatus Bostrichicola ureolyticus]|nr:MAG: 1-acyl-sn-glycerol-3-phosphate acyltransferase [Candidatus Bostrichicola ureolyticus]